MPLTVLNSLLPLLPQQSTLISHTNILLPSLVKLKLISRLLNLISKSTSKPNQELHHMMSHQSSLSKRLISPLTQKTLILNLPEDLLPRSPLYSSHSSRVPFSQLSSALLLTELRTLLIPLLTLISMFMELKLFSHNLVELQLTMDKWPFTTKFQATHTSRWP
jgi:hypothetical protein